MSSEQSNVGPSGESGLWLDGDPSAEIEPKAGDRGVCGVEGCGKDVVLVNWKSVMDGGFTQELRWKHAGPMGFMLDHNHTPVLSSSGRVRVEVEGETEAPKVAPRPTHKNQVMSEIWNTLFVRRTGDDRELPGLLFEAMEPFFEGAYEAGQDQWRDWLNQDGGGELGKTAEIRAELLAAHHSGKARPKFGKWWVSSDD